MTINIRGLFLTLIGPILFVSAVLLFWKTHEPVYEWIPTGLRGEARHNPLLAAGRLLERMGISAESLHSLPVAELPMEPYDTLVLWQEETSMRMTRIEPILDWVKQGGRLVLSSENYLEDETDTSDSSHLLAAFDIRQYRSSWTWEEDEDTGPLEASWGGKTLRVDFNPMYYLATERADLQHISSEYGKHLVSFRWGSGYVMVVSDLLFMDNHNIGKHDHAEFFWHLLHTSGTTHKIWLLAPGDGGMPALWELLWQHARYFVISAALLLIFVLWAAGRRFGPLLPVPSQSRRRLLEHLDAGGRFLWHAGQAAHLHHAVVQSLWERLEAGHPDWPYLPRHVLATRLARLTEFSSEEIEQALRFGDEAGNYKGRTLEARFTQDIRVLTQIRNRL